MDGIPPLFFVDRSGRGRLRLTGRDRQSFLQGMVTNDILALKPGEGCYALQLDATGHVLADMRVLCRADDLLLDVEPGMAQSVAATLEKYLIMERVRIADVSEETTEVFVGATDADCLDALGLSDMADCPEGENREQQIGGVQATVAAVRLSPGCGFSFYAPAERKTTLLAGLAGHGASFVEEDTLEALRIEAGVPRFGADMDSRTLAPETGQASRAISYKKGCYIGQEIVARIDARGHTNRALCGFLLAEGAPLPNADAEVTADGKAVGRITSAAQSLSPSLGGRPIALGYIRHEFAPPGTKVSVDGTAAFVAALPFVERTTTQ